MRAAAARALRTAAALAALASTAIAAEGASRFDPALRFRVLATEHFVIHFDRRDERVARRLAVIAEETWRSLERPLGVRPPPLTRVVLADQTEFANGFATPLPYDTIVIYTVWPSGSEFVFDDWLRLAFTHEFTHIVHLDRSEGWARIARGIFGRTPYAFPNLYLPPWQIEGLATYEESAITGEGRLHAGDFRAIVGEAARQRSLEPLDRVNGGLTDWPSSAAPYAYGVDFHAYLVDRFGAERLASLAAATARRFPYTSTRAFRYVYGESLGDLWRDYEATREAAAAAPAADAGIVRVTRDGFSVSGPRFDRFVCAGCPPAIFYAAANPRGFPSLARVALDGSSARRVATRYLGSTSAIGPHTIYFDQVERRRNVGVYSDLYALSRADGRVHALTSNARLRDPDLAPDGHALAAVQQKPGQRDLVVAPLGANGDVDRDSIAVLAGEPDAYFDAPRWSPDGRSIAVVRHPLGAMPEIVIVDAVTGRQRVVAAEPRTRFATPAWRPDGRALVVAAARGDETFNLFEVAVDGSTLRQLTHTSGGALWPDVSPDGRTIVFAGYTTAGYDVFTMPYPLGAGPEPPPNPFGAGSERVPNAFGVRSEPAPDPFGAGSERVPHVFAATTRWRR
jgi:WD40 repeat protein